MLHIILDIIFISEVIFAEIIRKVFLLGNGVSSSRFSSRSFSCFFALVNLDLAAFLLLFKV